ncbi:MAG: hypothetical protein JWL86_3850 [Rhizobium sp.]|nr:hypothetical protein [Rhizobium sp.]
MKKFILATAAAMIATLGYAHVAEAGWRHHNNHFGTFNIVIVAPRYVVDDYGYGDCYVKKTVRYNRYGERVVKKVKFCD